MHTGITKEGAVVPGVVVKSTSDETVAAPRMGAVGHVKMVGPHDSTEEALVFLHLRFFSGFSSTHGFLHADEEASTHRLLLSLETDDMFLCEKKSAGDFLPFLFFFLLAQPMNLD